MLFSTLSMFNKKHANKKGIVRTRKELYKQMKKYYACWYRLDERFAFFLWHSDEPDGCSKDGVVLDERGYLLAFQTKPALLHYAQLHNMPLDNEDPPFYDLDLIKQWIERPTEWEINCNHFLGAWNLFEDVAASLADSKYPGNESRYTPVYDKLFWGNNLPAMTPPGEHFDPIWDEDEVEQIQEVLRSGLQMFGDCTRDA